MTLFAEVSYRAQVRRLRCLAQQALSQYALYVDSFQLIDHWNNATFDVQDTQGQRYVLRINRPGFQNLVQVQSEVEWLRLIRQETDLRVPEVVADQSGQTVVVVHTEDVPDGRVCVMFRRRHGFFYGAGLLPTHYEKAGFLLGQLHSFAKQVVLPGHFERKTWTTETALGHVSGVDQNAFRRLLTTQDESVYQAVWEWYEDTWHALGKTADVFGVIHGDFHPRNILFMPDGVGAIDFDECGWGHYLHDVAVALMGIRNHERYADLRHAFLYGYEQSFLLPENCDVFLDAFMAGRMLGLAVWTAGVTDHPWNRALAPQVVAETMHNLREMIKRRR